MNNEFYNLYIEADEEVTTIISRLHLARANRVALIVPQHALVLQSIINLRLLARESKKQQKDIVVVTQDEEGIAFAQRVGIFAVPLQEWQEKTKEYERTKEGVSTGEQSQNDDQYSQELPENTQSLDSGDFTPSHDDVNETQGVPAQFEQPQRHQMRSVAGMDIARSTAQSSTVIPPEVDPVSQYSTESLYEETQHSQAVPVIVKTTQESQYEDFQSRQTQKPQRPQSEASVAYDEMPQENLKPQGKKSSHKKKFEHAEKDSQGQNPRVSKISRYVWSLACIAGLSVAGFLILPLSYVSVNVGEGVSQQDLSITAKVSFEKLDTERRMVPLRRIEKEVVRTLEAKATGKGDVDAQKARGTLKISNTFSTQSQSLVATTRFESPDGTVFRLLKNTTVPGMKKDGEKVTAGTVEVSVEADKAGTDGNVAPTTWTIPGFASNTSKFEKFSAKNASAMSGGNTGGKGVAIATAKDIEALTQGASKGNDEFVAKQMKDLVRETETLLPEALEYEITRSESSVKEGVATDMIKHTVNIKVNALIFSTNDIEQLLSQELGEKEKTQESQKENGNIAFSEVVPDFSDNKLTMRATSSYQLDTNLDINEFRQVIKSKEHSEIKDILKQEYPFVKDIAITTYPRFPEAIGTKFSRFPWMTQIKIEEEQ